MRRIFLLSLFLGNSLSGFAQQGFDPGNTIHINIQKTGEVQLSAIKEDYFPSLQSIEMPEPGSEAYQEYLESIKEKIRPVYSEKKSMRMGTIADPNVAKGFTGNPWAQNAPNDNDIAISDSGLIVSVINSTLNVYDTAGKSLKSVSLAAFSGSLGLPESKYDPRVLYDPEAKRFIVAFLNGFNDSTSYTVLAFSKTSDPLGGWNLYSLSGNPMNDTTWSDYPIIALYKDQLILTLNALQNNKSWQLGFRQSYIWQIGKWNGYHGTSLKTLVHSNIKYDGKPLRNVCPVQGGSGLTSGEAYLVSNKNFSPLTDSIFLLKLTDTIGGSNNKLTCTLLHSDNKYGVPPTAHQPYKQTFETNDARVLDALIENGTIQFVGNTLNPSTAKAAVFHGVIADATTTKPTVHLNIIADNKLELGYPAIAYAGRNRMENDAVILLNHTSDSVKPGMSAVLYRNGEYSSIMTLKQGANIVNVISGSQRWGDYSGAQTLYSNPGTVWLGGTFGNTQKVGPSSSPVYGTWIAELKNTSDITGVSSLKSPEHIDAVTYPSPASNGQTIHVDFHTRQSAYLYFRIYDLSGRLVKELLAEHTQEGKNTFSFDASPLKAGSYILLIEDTKNNRIAQSRFIIK